MGTTYHVTLVGVTAERATALQARIDGRLEAGQRQHVDLPAAERAQPLQPARPGVASRSRCPPTCSAVLLARPRGSSSSPAAPGTHQVLPLVNLWGFGPAGPVDEPPSEEDVKARLAHVGGFDRIEIRKRARSSRRTPGSRSTSRRSRRATESTRSPLSCAGDGVRRLHRRDRRRDLRVGRVRRCRGRPWRVGINRPRADAAPDDVFGVALLRDQAFATSGDYRNYFQSGPAAATRTSSTRARVGRSRTVSSASRFGLPTARSPTASPRR